MQPEAAYIKNGETRFYFAQIPCLQTETSRTETKNGTFPISPNVLFISESLPLTIQFPQVPIHCQKEL